MRLDKEDIDLITAQVRSGILQLNEPLSVALRTGASCHIPLNYLINSNECWIDMEVHETSLIMTIIGWGQILDRFIFARSIRKEQDNEG